MSSLIEITGDDIAELGDAELRELIGRLCEADYRSAGLSTSGITWGGHQDAVDGGLDVVVRDNVSPPVASSVPTNLTGFQVKKSDMPRSAILNEMRPEGVLRKSIKALLQDRGAYIIVSSKGSTSDTAIKNRIKAMKEAVADEAGHKNFHLDFFDRGRIATWVRSHPSLVIWVREKIGKPLRGWQPYKNWAQAPEGINEEYILDDGLRLYDQIYATDRKLSVGEGLSKLRTTLTTPSKCTRLVGLSGVGKTRLVQALFDNRVGEYALDQNQAIYTDMSHSPAPDPVSIAEQLINDRSRAILIIDNCPPDLHCRLTQVCSTQNSTVSLLTVEYDVRDDLPEETSVFRLEPASEEIIEKLILSRENFAHISQIDARTIARISGGNARVAIALANTIRLGETLSGFRDEQLFERLFWQRNKPDKILLVSAEVCSLVYSFEGTDTSSQKSEIKFLASLGNQSSSDLYRGIAELIRRNLIQSRGVWRAVLPHAIANWLAKRALESIPKDALMNGFMGASERLIKSFTHRLSYLHDCKAVIDIVNDWLDENGWIGKSVGNLNDLGITVLNNIAPVSEAKTLEAIERAVNGSSGEVFTSRSNSHLSEFVRLLRHLAYDPALFHRSVKMLCCFALSEGKDGSHSHARETLRSLFYIYLSGTQARIEARAKIINELVDSEDENKQELGLFLLEATLKTSLFNSSHEFSFGARPRDFGYRPQTQEEIARWFDTVIDICTRSVLSGRSISKQAEKMLEDNMRGLWIDACAFDAIEESVRKILGQGAWNGGWIAVRKTLQVSSKNSDDEVRDRLCRLEKLLRPGNLLEKARAFALSSSHGVFDLEDNFDKEEAVSARIRRTVNTTRKIGVEVAQDTKALDILLPEIVSTDNTRLFHFGMGLAEGSRDREALFQTLHAALGKIPPEKRRIGVFNGFLAYCAKSDPMLHDSIFDKLIRDDLLGEWFPVIQEGTSSMDQKGVQRLHEALDFGKAQIFLFQNLGVHDSISDDDLAGLVKNILSKEDGVGVALEILQMRFYVCEGSPSKYSDGLMKVSRDLLTAYSFEDKRAGNDPDYKLAQLVSICLDGSEGCHTAKIFCQNTKEAILNGRASCNGYPQLLNSLAKTQPTLFLDVFLDEDVEDYQIRRMFNDGADWYDNPLGQVLDTDLLTWCEKKPSSRYPLVALAIDAFEKSEETGRYEWNPFVHTIFKNAPDLEATLKKISYTLRPTGWSGSLADILQSRSVLYQDLYEHENVEVVAWAKDQFAKLQAEIIIAQKWENQEGRDRDERFE